MEAKATTSHNQIALEAIPFELLFQEIGAEEIPDNVFTLVGKDYYVITAGKIDHYNSMTGSGGGMGMLFMKPCTWCVLRSDRYTLELIEKEQCYTMSYFPEEHKQQMILLGSNSGRDTDKMKDITLSSIQTPSGTITFKEARLILECRLTEITTPNPSDFYSPEAKEYITEAYKEASDYRKYVFGEITHVWVKK
jgi:flavin reductase (DIM6/NTAB) family NADH-FMN oxidoreductase RutF